MKNEDKLIVKKISQCMLDKKALDIKIIYVKKITSITDYFVFCSSESEPQTRAIANHIKDTLFDFYNIKPWHMEGYENSKWVLIDYVNIVVNIFNKDERSFYNIERLWEDGDITIIEEKK